MYINQFLAGVLATIFIEVVVILGVAITSYVKEKNKEDK